MSDARTDTASIVERIRPVAAGGPVVAVHFLGDEAVFVLGEETLLFWRDAAERRVAVHAGGILGDLRAGVQRGGRLRVGRRRDGNHRCGERECAEVLH